MPHRLKARLAKKPILLAPGVCDPLTAALAAEAGAEAIYLSGAAMSYTRLGRPDIGLMTMTEVAEVIGLVRDRVATPMIVDADNGHGNALNMQRTMRLYERAGANALQIEDQSYPKRCGHLAEKRLIPKAEMVGKIKAALDARDSADTLLIARTDAVAVEGLEAALERADAYAEAGADALFVEAPGSREQLARISSQLGGIPLMANMVEGGKTPILPARELQELGYSLVIFPGGIVRAMAFAARDFYATLVRDGTSDAMRNRMFDFGQINDIVGTAEMMAAGKAYEGAE